MNRIALDNLEEAVKRFFLTLALDAHGSVLESNSRPVVCVFPAALVTEGLKADEPLTVEKNACR